MHFALRTSLQNNGIMKTARFSSGTKKKGKELLGSGHFSWITRGVNASEVLWLNDLNEWNQLCAMQVQSRRARVLHGGLFSLTEFTREGFGTHILTRYASTERIGTLRQSATRARESEAPDQCRSYMQQHGWGHDHIRLLLSAFLLHSTTCKAARMRLCSLGNFHQGEHLLQQRQEQALCYGY